jgi:plasmid replication initiation protein
MANIQKKKSGIVKIKNDLIESFIKQNNLTALKVLFYLAYECENVPDEQIITVRMDTKQLLEFCNLDTKTLIRNLEKMQKTSISWSTAKSKKFISVLPKCEIVYGGQVQITLFREVLELIYDVKNKYTLVNSEQLMLMRSKHSARMLLLLEMINGFDAHIPKLKRFTLDEINQLFGTNYKRMGQFEQEVLKKSQSDLDDNSKITFTYQINYDKDVNVVGRAKAVGVTIFLKDNNPQPKLF